MPYRPEYYQKNKKKILAGNKVRRDKPANKKRAAEHFQKYYAENKERYLEYFQTYYEKCFKDDLFMWKRSLRTIKQRAVRKGVKFGLTPEYMVSITPKNCPVLGIKLKRARGYVRNSSPSVDRIVAKRGYVVGNVIVVSSLANLIRNSATPEQIQKVADYYQKLLRCC